MPLFNKKILEKNLKIQEIPATHLTLLQNWQERILSHDLEKQTEVALQGVFMQNILIEILGYQAFSENQTYTIAKEYPVANGAVDLALGQFFNDKQGNKVQAVFELKGAKTKNLDAIMSGRFKTPVEQAWDYAVNAKGCDWVLVSNYVEIRLYAFGFTKKNYETFELVKLTEPAEYARFMLCLQADNLLKGATKQLLRDSEQASKDITEQFYHDYKAVRETLITRLIADNPEIAPLDLIAPAQKLLDRVLFIAFCEDRGLLPKNSIKQAYEFVCVYDPQPVYRNFRGLFKAVDRGSLALNVSGYNGGLFAYDKFFDKLIIADELCKGFVALAEYDFSSEISVTVLGHIFEQSIADLEEISAQLKEGKELQTSAQATSVTGKRKQQGVVYTPDHITAFIVEQTVENYLQQQFAACLAQFQLEKDGATQWKRGAKTELNFWKAWLLELKAIKIVDPACGSGAFLVAAFDFLHQEYEKVNAKIAELSQSQSVFDLNKEILQHNLLGVDINSESIEITKLSLWLKTAEKRKKLVSIDEFFQKGNSLGFVQATPDSEFCWQTAFPTIMENGGFDIVIGNPPYVRQELLGKMKPYLQEHYAVYHGVVDLYAYFFEVALKLLKPNGMLGFISSSTFFKTSSGEPLRRFLQENATLKKVVDFGDLQVFEGVTTYPAILIFQNAKPETDSDIQFLALQKDLPEKLSDFFKEQHQLMLHSQLRSDSWQLESAVLHQLRHKLTAGYPTLKDAYGSPYRGVLTGLNKAFVIDKATKEKLIKQHPNSAQLLKPFLEGKDLKKWHCQPRGLWLIFTRRGTDIEQYPAIKKHLAQYREQLEPKPADFPKNKEWQGRKEGIYQWFEIQDPTAYYEEFEKPKLVWSHFQSEPLFSINKQNGYVNCKGYLTTDFDNFLLGLLNSKTIWFIFKNTTTMVRGGFYEAKNQIIEKLPIPLRDNQHPITFETYQAKENIAQLAAQCQFLAEQRYGLERNVQLSITALKIKKITRKLEHWWNLEFNAFLDELAKQKIEIPLKKQAEWGEFLSDATQEHQTFDLQIAELEIQLNQAVYQLFDLTIEEIKLIEEK